MHSGVLFRLPRCANQLELPNAICNGPSLEVSGTKSEKFGTAKSDVAQSRSPRPALKEQCQMRRRACACYIAISSLRLPIVGAVDTLPDRENLRPSLAMQSVRQHP